MIPSRRQRYFRPTSPIHSIPTSSAATSSGVRSANMNVLEQAELVIEGGDPSDDHQQVAHEEIVDDEASEMPMEHHHHHQQMHHQLRHVPMTYDDRGAYQVQPQAIRRAVGRPNAPPPRSNYQNPMDMVQKLQNKSLYMPSQRPMTRISPTGARIVSFAGRKRENPEQLPPGVKKMNIRGGVVGQPVGKNLQPVKVVRLAPGGHRNTPSVAEQAIMEIDANIKQTIEDSKIDMQRVKDLQDAEFSQEEYHQMMGVLLMELERANTANSTLNQFYRDRQRHEKTIFDAREDAYLARIRQLETEMRKLRDAVLMMHMGKFGEAGEAGGQNPYRHDHMGFQGQLMVEEQEDQVVIEEHVEKQGDYADADNAPEWIVEETVEHQHSMQGYEDELQQEEHQELEADSKTKTGLMGNEQFGSEGGNEQ